MKTEEDVRAALDAAGLGHLFETLKPYIKNSVRMTPEAAGDDEIAVGASKLGGLPDLPPETEWFKEKNTGVPLSFVCQINFAEVKPYDLENKLPDSGLLSLFYDYSVDGMPWGYDPEDASGWAVHYYDGDMSRLERREAPSELADDELGCVFGAAKLSFESVAELPDFESDAWDSSILEDDESETYADIRCGEDDVISKLLGHSDNIQGGMEFECELTANRINCGGPEGYAEGREKGLEKNIGRWDLLMQIDNNYDLGMEWGDCGRLYLWMTDDDLKNKNFSAAWLILQCC